MKKTIIILSLIATAFKSNSQTKDSIYVCYDTMTEEYKAITPYYILDVNKEKTKALRVEVMLNYEDGGIKYNGLCTRAIGIGNCVEKDRIIIMFADGTKYTSISWSGFDCDGYSFYDLKGEDEALINKKITAIMFINGRSYDNYKFNVSDADANYFQKVFKAIANKKYKQVNCE